VSLFTRRICLLGVDTMARDNTSSFRRRESIILQPTYDIEEDWPKLVKKWRYGIKDLEDKDLLKEYTRTKIWVYEIEAISDTAL
jgi:N-acetyl-gamma-glutamylphosphate reductase